VKLEGSCACGSVIFVVESETPYPYRYCYCKRCRKTQGGMGAQVSVLAKADTLVLHGEENVSVFEIKSGSGPNAPPSDTRLYFCAKCGSHLYMTRAATPSEVYLSASAVDTPLPVPPELYHVNIGEAAAWIHVPNGTDHIHFNELDDETARDWHRRHGLAGG
jgi:hypothetical protein